MREPDPRASLRRRLAVAVGPVASVRSLGDTAWMVEVEGRRLVAKTGPGAVDEAAGLRQLGGVPEVHPSPTSCSSRPIFS